jgi:hypothetical protein
MSIAVFSYKAEYVDAHWLKTSNAAPSSLWRKGAKLEFKNVHIDILIKTQLKKGDGQEIQKTAFAQPVNITDHNGKEDYICMPLFMMNTI